MSLPKTRGFDENGKHDKKKERGKNPQISVPYRGRTRSVKAAFDTLRLRLRSRPPFWALL